MKSRNLFFLLFIMNSLLCQNPPDTLWTNVIGGVNNDSSTCVRQTSDGGLVVFGSTDPLGNGMNDIWLLKTDESGNLLWDATFGGDQNDISMIGQQTIDNGYIIVGFTDSFGNGLRDFWLIKTDEEGNEEWNQTYGTEQNDRGQYVEQTSDGGYILTGGTGNFETSNEDIWLIKTDANGIMEWEQTFGGNGNEKAYTVHQETNGCYILAGLTSSYGNGNFDIWLIKTDESGNEIWNRTFGGAENENAYSLQICPDGGYILAGCTKSFGQGEYDVWLIKTDSLGFEEWNGIYGTEYVDYCYSVALTSDNCYVLGGLTNSTTNSDYDILAMKIGEFGEEIWTVKVGGSSNDFSFFIEQTDDEGYVLTGYSNSFGNGNNDIYLIKLESDVVESKNNLHQPSGFNLRNYPNPFNPTTTISFNLTAKDTQNTELAIYNLKGQKIRQYSIFNNQSSITWNGTDQSNNPVSSGIYFYKFRTGGYEKTKKMILIR